jgi:hypothetical protein
MKKNEILKMLQHGYTSPALRDLNLIEYVSKVIEDEINSDIWKSLTSAERLEARKIHLDSFVLKCCPDLKTYYENLIQVCTSIEGAIKRFEDLLDSGGAIGNRFDLLQCLVLLQIEHRFLNESYLPINHIDTKVFEGFSDLFSSKHSELKFYMFVTVYRKMYLLWPGKQNEDKCDKNQWSNKLAWPKKLTILTNFRNKFIDDSSFMRDNLSEFSLVDDVLYRESWKQSDAEKKQTEREWFLNRSKNIHSVIDKEYIFRLINSSALINAILNDINSQLVTFADIENADLSDLRIYTVTHIAKDYLDEHILPHNLLHPKFIQNIAKDYDQQYPELKLNELSKVYTEMYELWPDRPDRDQEKPEK